MGSEGRSFDYRTAYQRDRDRVLYSRAFRRLHDKTQLYLAESEQQHRNRLTHTLEVAQVARTLARALRLNEDLVEAIALAHDLGRAPFGRSGEAALAEILEEAMPAERRWPFRPNLQALRVVDLLEVRYEGHRGLNLTHEVREGILKHMPLPPEADPDLETTELKPEMPAHLEGQAVSLADRLVTPVHDVDDALEAGDLPLDAVERSGVGRVVVRRLGPRYEGARGTFGRRNLLHRSILHLLVTDAIVTSGGALERWAETEGVSESADFLAARDRLRPDTVDLSGRGASFRDELRQMVRARVVGSRRVTRSDERARKTIRALLDTFHDNPRLLPDHVLLRYKSVARVRFLRDLPPAEATPEVRARYRGRPRFLRVLADHIAGMTDGHALAEAARLTGPGERTRR
jgi:dGTPase